MAIFARLEAPKLDHPLLRFEAPMSNMEMQICNKLATSASFLTNRNLSSRHMSSTPLLYSTRPHQQFYIKRRSFTPKFIQRFMYRHPKVLLWTGVVVSSCLMVWPFFRDWFFYPIIMSKEDYEEYARIGRERNKDMAVYGINWKFLGFKKPFNFVHPEVAKRQKMADELEFLAKLEEEKRRFRDAENEDQ